MQLQSNLDELPNYNEDGNDFSFFFRISPWKLGWYPNTDWIKTPVIERYHWDWPATLACLQLSNAPSASLEVSFLPVTICSTETKTARDYIFGLLQHKCLRLLGLTTPALSELPPTCVLHCSNRPTRIFARRLDSRGRQAFSISEIPVCPTPYLDCSKVFWELFTNVSYFTVYGVMVLFVPKFLAESVSAVLRC